MSCKLFSAGINALGQSLLAVASNCLLNSLFYIEISVCGFQKPSRQSTVPARCSQILFFLIV